MKITKNNLVKYKYSTENRWSTLNIGIGTKPIAKEYIFIEITYKVYKNRYIYMYVYKCIVIYIYTSYTSYTITYTRLYIIIYDFKNLYKK